MQLFYISVLGLCLFLSACSTFTVDRYSISIDNNEAIKNVLQDKKIDVDEFSSKDVQRSIDCRIVGPVVIPDGKTFAQYIKKALIDELKLAGNYDKLSPIRMSGLLKEVDFSSTSGTWYVVVQVKLNNGVSFEIHEEYDYRTAYIAQVACMNTARAFMPAVQDLVYKIITHPDFRKMFSNLN